jgi:hypothetical protein
MSRCGMMTTPGNQLMPIAQSVWQPLIFVMRVVEYRTFYEDLIDLKLVVPPSVLYGEGGADKPDAKTETKDGKDAKDAKDGKDAKDSKDAKDDKVW